MIHIYETSVVLVGALMLYFFCSQETLLVCPTRYFNEAPNTRMLVAAQAPDTAVVFVAHRARARLEADFADLSDLVQGIDIF